MAPRKRRAGRVARGNSQSSLQNHCLQRKCSQLSRDCTRQGMHQGSAIVGWFRFLWGGATGRTHEWSGPAEDQRRTLRGGGRVATTGLYFSQAPIINLLRSRHTARRTTAGCACARPGSSTGSAVGGPVEPESIL